MHKHSAPICGGLITLHRWHCAASPDELGTLAYWEAQFWALYNALPFRDLWDGLDVFVVHMDHPQLEDETRAGIANLQDYDTTRAGYQVAAGLYWNRDKLHVGVFPAGWRAEDPPLGRPVTAADVARAVGVLAHEIGHFFADFCGYGRSATLIQREITRWFDQLSPVQAENLAERYAEVCRAFFGPPGFRGYFSDGKPYGEANNPRLYSLMSAAYWLQAALARLDFTDLDPWSDRVIWQEWTRNWWGQRLSNGWYSLDRAWRRWRWGVTGKDAAGREVYGWLPA